MKKTVVIGASSKSNRYSNAACRMLKRAGIDFVPVGISSGMVDGVEILDLRQKPPIPNVHTVTMYISPRNQPEWYSYILSLNPQRIIFNPGTENPEFARQASEGGIEVEFACSLVLLSTGQF